MHVGAEEKRSFAGPSPEQSTEGGLSKKGKPSANQNEVTSLIKQLKLSGKNTAACFWLDNTSLLQRKIQQLEKQFRPFVVYTAGPNNQLLLSDNPSMNDASVISYDSKGPVHMLNCMARNRTDGKKITCRHLAYAFATGGFGFKTSANQSELKEPGGKFSTVASIDDIQNNPAIKTDQQLERTPVRGCIPKIAVYFDAEHFGQALYDVWVNKGAGDQASHGKPSQTWLLETENHVMAIKLVSTTGSAIKIEWYDPNNTTIVRRVIVLNEEILQQLTLNQFASVPQQQSYAIDQGGAGVLMSTDAVEVENDSVATVMSALTPSLLHLLMQHGQLNNRFMDSIVATLLVMSASPRERIALLTAKNVDGGPGLAKALQIGHQESVNAHVEGIKQLRDILEPETIRELLAAKNRDGMPGLFMALQNGHRKAISAYVNGIKQLRDIIEPKVLKELLAAKRGDGTPGLFMALEDGHQGAVRAYMKGVRKLRDIIGPEVMRELLAAKNGDGTPGLYLALQYGHHKAIRAYVDGIKQLGDIIEPAAIKELLTAKRGDGAPAIFVALQSGHQEAIRAYAEGIKQFGDINGMFGF